MPSVNKIVRENIDRLIAERGLSFPALAQLMHRSDNTIYRVVDRRDTPMKLDWLELFARALDVPVTELVTPHIPRDNRIKKICGSCGGDSIRVDAWAAWDLENQCWKLDTTFEDKFCLDCEMSVTVKDEVIING